MKDVINFELSEKLSEARLLDNIDCQYGYYYTSDNGYMITEVEYEGRKIVGIDYKTLTVTEAIEFLREKFKKSKYDINIKLLRDGYLIELLNPYVFQTGKTLLEAVEAMITRLLNNGLLEKSK